jgi:Flp pilus assembly protein CpaB
LAITAAGTYFLDQCAQQHIVAKEVVIADAGAVPVAVAMLDVFVTMRDPGKKIDRTKMILQDILVLATGTHIQHNDQGEPAPVDIYTLAITSEEAEQLALSVVEGKLQFVVKRMTDEESPDEKHPNIYYGTAIAAGILLYLVLEITGGRKTP